MTFDPTNTSDSTNLTLPAVSLATLAVVFAADLSLPMGYAIWAFYFVPVALTAMSMRPRLPYFLGAIATVFAAAGFLLIDVDPHLVEISRINRGFGIVTLWIVAFIAHRAVVASETSARLQWKRDGRTALLENIRGLHTAVEVAETGLASLAKHVGADVAVAYLESDGRFEVASRYGFSVPETGRPVSFAAGEGLVGRAALEKKVLRLKPPRHYLTVSSALGSADSVEVAVVPGVFEDGVNVIAEFGFLHPMTEAQSRFLNMVAEDLGIAVFTARQTERLQTLLAETQRQGEELQAQQEELRVVNEELQEQATALKESQAQLENQHAELEQTNEQLEEQTQALELQKEQLEMRNQELATTKRYLEEKTRELQDANRYQAEFLANMSHELRTPLNSTLILAKLLAENNEGNLNEEQLKYAETIYSSGNDLLQLINDILDLAKVEAGKLEIHRQPIALGELIEGAKRMFAPLAAAKGLEFEARLAPEAPEQFISDRLRVEQVLNNLLGNAIKFTPAGKVELVLGGDDDNVWFAVRDTGIGIESDQQEQIFQAFRQADGTTSRKFGGTGLGLSISRELARLLGGTISLRSQPEEGSEFTVTLPRELVEPRQESSVDLPVPARYRLLPERPRVAAEPTMPAADDSKQQPDPGLKQGHTVLIVEDDPGFAETIVSLAGRHNFHGLVATSAEEAMALAYARQPDAILLDLGLPDHSGLTVLDRIKEDPTMRHIPVHVISGMDFERQALGMGAMGYLLKPVKKEQLESAFGSLQKTLSQTMKSVLIVEDDAVQRESIAKLLSDGDVAIEAVATGREAISLLGKRTYDCMIMDLSLGDMTGFDLLEELTAYEHSFPPTIVYTGRDLTRDEESRLRKYSESIIIKGARSPERLLNETSLFLHRVESKMAPDRRQMLHELRHREKTFANRTILLVDDDARNIFALTSVLERKGAKVVFARNGIEAIDKLHSDPSVELILMDMMMPEMDGYEATRRIRSEKRYADLPIIAITARAMKDDQVRCLEAGANDFLSKPVDTEKLMSLMRVWLPKHGWMNA